MQKSHPIIKPIETNKLLSSAAIAEIKAQTQNSATAHCIRGQRGALKMDKSNANHFKKQSDSHLLTATKGHISRNPIGLPAKKFKENVDGSKNSKLENETFNSSGLRNAANLLATVISKIKESNVENRPKNPVESEIHGALINAFNVINATIVNSHTSMQKQNSKKMEYAKFMSQNANLLVKNISKESNQILTQNSYVITKAATHNKSIIDTRNVPMITPSSASCIRSFNNCNPTNSIRHDPTLNPLNGRGNSISFPQGASSEYDEFHQRSDSGITPTLPLKSSNMVNYAAGALSNKFLTQTLPPSVLNAIAAAAAVAHAANLSNIPQTERTCVTPSLNLPHYESKVNAPLENQKIQSPISSQSESNEEKNGKHVLEPPLSKRTLPCVAKTVDTISGLQSSDDMISVDMEQEFSTNVNIVDNLEVGNIPKDGTSLCHKDEMQQDGKSSDEEALLKLTENTVCDSRVPHHDTPDIGK